MGNKRERGELIYPQIRCKTDGVKIEYFSKKKKNYSAPEGVKITLLLKLK